MATLEEEIKAVRLITGRLDGWLHPLEGEYLYKAARNCQGKGVIVEIGSWKGKSTIWLAKGSQAGNGVKVYAIDPHTGSPECRKQYEEVWTYPEFEHNIVEAGVQHIVIPLIKTSKEARQEWDGKPIELLWIDGAHEYEMVKEDFEVWSHYLVEGGIIAFHDTIGWRGPRRLVREEIYTSRNFADVRFIMTSTFAQKVNKNTVMQRLRNNRVLFLKDMCELGSILHPPSPVRMLAHRIIRGVQ
jgi:MMP 1-O-methyltransferase